MLVAAPGPPLVRSQLAWVAALILFAQLPLWPRLPLWVVAVGSGLVAARLLLPADHPVPTRVRRWLLPTLALLVAIGVRTTYGYFLARDPCVAFLYTLVGVKFLESRDARDGALLACLAPARNRRLMCAVDMIPHFTAVIATAH